jgi:hypothetical protein
MQRRIDLLALSYPLNDLCDENDIDPAIVVRWLVDEGLIELDEYFDDGEGEEET